MGIIRLKEYEKDFETEEFEIYVLIKDATAGGMHYNEYLRQVAYTYATMDCQTKILDRREGVLTWLVTTDNIECGYDFKNYGIYKLLVRKAKIKELDAYTIKSWNNHYLVLDVLERDSQQSELEALSTYLQQPKVIRTQSGEFILNRKDNQYERKLPNLNISLALDQDTEEDCHVALKVFENYEMTLSQLDNKLKKYITETMLEDANEWQESAEKSSITEKMFADRISLMDLCFYNDGSVEAFYDDADIFWGHCIVVSMDQNGTVTEAELMG